MAVDGLQCVGLVQLSMGGGQWDAGQVSNAFAAASFTIIRQEGQPASWGGVVYVALRLEMSVGGSRCPETQCNTYLSLS